MVINEFKQMEMNIEDPVFESSHVTPKYDSSLISMHHLHLQQEQMRNVSFLG